MKLFMKITPPSQVAQEQSIFRHCDENNLSLTRNKKAAQRGDTEAARQNIYRTNFNQLGRTLKAMFIRLAAWLSIVGGSLL